MRGEHGPAGLLPAQNREPEQVDIRGALISKKGGRHISLKLIPVSLKNANRYVAEYHRHHKPVQGHKFSIGVLQDGNLAGVAIVGRPVSRYLDDGWTLEVTRLCTDGTKNACSMLYAAAARAAKAIGYRKIITYTLESESGKSILAAGWSCKGLAGGPRWTGKRAPPADLYPAQMKKRYEKDLTTERGKST